MKIQPIDFNQAEPPPEKSQPEVKPVLKSRFKRLFERPFSNVLRIPPPDKTAGATVPQDGSPELEASSVCLAKMVQNFIEESHEKPQKRCEIKRCNCFNGNCTDSSDSEEETDPYKFSSMDATHVLKGLVPCLCIFERNLLADTAKIVERNKISKLKDGLCREIVADGLVALGHNASICKSKWEKSPSVPAGEYEYIDVVLEDQRYIIDIEFRSEFEIARPTKAYKMVLQTLPDTFVGTAVRLEKIIGIVSEAARQSLKIKGMPLPPWRRADYVKAKWLSPFTRITTTAIENEGEKCESNGTRTEFELILGSCLDIRRKSLHRGVKIVTGLASVVD